MLRERYAEITAMDRAIGQLRTRLTELNIRENTVLWYCGDNGSRPSYGRVVTPFRKEKGHVYEGGIRVPGLIEWPAKIKQGRIGKVNGVTSDMLPTLCAWAGVKLPERPLDGISLAPLLEGKNEDATPADRFLELQRPPRHTQWRQALLHRRATTRHHASS